MRETGSLTWVPERLLIGYFYPYLIAAIVVLIPGCASVIHCKNVETVQSAGISLIDASKAEKIRTLIDKTRAEHNIPGLSLAIALDNKIVFSEGFGDADLENHVHAAPLSAYRTASIGKPMTATAIMRMKESGRINLKDPVQKYCPAFPKKEKGEITVEHLLTHQSGIRHYGGPNDYNEKYNTRHYDSVIQALDIFKGDPLQHKPGDKFTYSSFGYNLLGCVLEGATGENYLTAMNRLIFEPAGMLNTRDDNPRAIIPNRARGYVIENGDLNNAISVDMSSKMPAGGFITTAIDLLKFAIASQSGELVNENTFAEMLINRPLNDGTLTDFGYGWAISPEDDPFYGYKEVLHGGSTPGVANILLMLPEENFAVSIMTNQESFREERGLLAEEIAKIMLGLGE